MTDPLDTRVVVFDFDGTLVDSAPIKTEAFAELYRPFGDEIAAEVRSRHLAAEGVSRFVKFREWHREILGRECDDEVAAALSAEFDRLVEERIVAAPEIPGARRALERLSEHLPLYIASATPEGSLRRIVAERGMSGFFADVHGIPTTKVDVIESVAGTHRCERSEVLMVGDAESDRQAAEQAGARFIGVVPRHVAVGETPTRGAGGEHPWNTPGSGVETVSDLSTLITSLL
jgi:phosphoglycolate phosphatase-like HAD superfamily hydrolase